MFPTQNFLYFNGVVFLFSLKNNMLHKPPKSNDEKQN